MIHISSQLAPPRNSTERQWRHFASPDNLRPAACSSYDWRSVGQSVPVWGHYLGSATIFSFSSKEIIFRFLWLFSMGRPLWRGERCVIYSYKCYWACQHSHSRVQVPQNLRPYLTVSWDGVPFLSLLTTRGATVEIRFDESKTNGIITCKGSN
jgi:hypothetical protein